MKILPLLLWSLAGAIPALAAEPAADASNEVTAVSSRIFNGYERTRLPDGSFKPESYGFAVGGPIDGTTTGLEKAPPSATSDPSIDTIKFTHIELAIEGPLRAEGYLPTTEPRDADLLIVVFWGRTIGTHAFAQSFAESGALVGGDIDAVDAHNAKLLGFDSSHAFDRGFDDPTNMMANIRRQVYSGIRDAAGEDRYFVILQAYDFQHAWKHHQAKKLWETRYSMTQRGHDFGQDLPRMTLVAAHYFGQESNGLQMRPIPPGQVNVGEVKSLGEVPQK